MSDTRRKLLGWLIGCLVIFIVFGNKGFRQWLGGYHKKRRLDRALTALRSENERLSRELSWIRQDPSYSEYLVRKNLGYVKKGEVEYQLIKKGKKTSAGNRKTIEPNALSEP